MRSIWAMPQRKGGVVHGDEGGAIGGFREAGFEPGKATVAELAMSGAGYDGVKHDEAEGEGFDGVVEKAVLGSGAGEVSAHLLAAVVVAGDDVDGDGEMAPEHGSEEAVFFGEAAIGKVASDEHGVRDRAEAGDGAERTVGHGVGFDDPAGGHALRPDVEIGELDDKRHESLPAVWAT